VCLQSAPEGTWVRWDRPLRAPPSRGCPVALLPPCVPLPSASFLCVVLRSLRLSRSAVLSSPPPPASPLLLSPRSSTAAAAAAATDTGGQGTRERAQTQDSAQRTQRRNPPSPPLPRPVPAAGLRAGRTEPQPVTTVSPPVPTPRTQAQERGWVGAPVAHPYRDKETTPVEITQAIAGTDGQRRVWFAFDASPTRPLGV
jgi:hypothetical protein